MRKQFILADNQDITREGLRAIIGRVLPDNDIIDVCDRDSLVKALEVANVPIVIIDFELFDLKDADDLESLSLRYPLSHWLLFGERIDETLTDRLGRDAYVSMLLKSNTRDEISTALQCTSRGDRYLCHQLSDRLLRGHYKSENHALTATEKEVLRLLAYGKTVKEIAAERNLSVHTVITHKKNIFRKIEVNTTHEATRYALRSGLIDFGYYII